MLGNLTLQIIKSLIGYLSINNCLDFFLNTDLEDLKHICILAQSMCLHMNSVSGILQLRKRDIFIHSLPK